MKHHVRVVSIVKQILSVIKLFYHRFVLVMHIIIIIHYYGNVEVFQVQFAIEQLLNVWTMLNVVMEHVNVLISLYLMKIKSAVGIERNVLEEMFSVSINLVDPCPVRIPNPPRIRYPGNCQRFIDCQQK